MSWQSYIDDQLLAAGFMVRFFPPKIDPVFDPRLKILTFLLFGFAALDCKQYASINGHDGSKWASSKGYEVRVDLVFGLFTMAKQNFQIQN